MACRSAFIRIGSHYFYSQAGGKVELSRLTAARALAHPGVEHIGAIRRRRAAARTRHIAPSVEKWRLEHHDMAAFPTHALTNFRP